MSLLQRSAKLPPQARSSKDCPARRPVHGKSSGENIMFGKPKAAFAAARSIALAVVASTALVACQSTGPELDAADTTPPKRMVTQGTASKIVAPNLTKCAYTNPKMNVRVAAVGEITATDGTVITMPAATALQKGIGPLSYDLYNECNQVTPPNSAAVSTDKVPVIEVDPDGEVITGFIVADNYYEMYVNGKLVSVDNTPYTPFNSAIVKFKVKRPYTMAFLLVDWDEHLRAWNGGVPGPGHAGNVEVLSGRRRADRQVQRRHHDRRHVEGADVLHRAAHGPEGSRRARQRA